MSFRKKPIIEEYPDCIVCGAWGDDFICSATCADIWNLREWFVADAMDQENDCS